MKAYLSSETSVTVVGDDGSHTVLTFPVANEPSSIGEHVDPALREAAQNPLSTAEWLEYSAALISTASNAAQEPVALADRLIALGIDVAELKTLLNGA
jgi:hypothetical protein